MSKESRFGLHEDTMRCQHTQHTRRSIGVNSYFMCKCFDIHGPFRRNQLEKAKIEGYLQRRQVVANHDEWAQAAPWAINEALKIL
jgi:hypothetical protein